MQYIQTAQAIALYEVWLNLWKWTA